MKILQFIGIFALVIVAFALSHWIVSISQVNTTIDSRSISVLETYIVVFSLFLVALGFIGYTGIKEDTKDYVKKDIDSMIEKSLEEKMSAYLGDIANIQKIQKQPAEAHIQEKNTFKDRVRDESESKDSKKDK